MVVSFSRLALFSVVGWARSRGPFPVVFRWVRNWFLRRWFPPPCFALGCSFRPLAISSAVGYLFPWMGVVSVAFLLVRWFGLVLVRFIRPRFFRSCRLALSSGAICQSPLSPKERRGTDHGKGHGDDHDAATTTTLATLATATTLATTTTLTPSSSGFLEGAFQIAYFLLRYTTSILFCIFLR